MRRPTPPPTTRHSQGAAPHLRPRLRLLERFATNVATAFEVKPK